jgi:uncharacterized protein YjbI with pentapeptide repeats
MVEIRHRWSRAVLWSGEASSTKDALEKAVRAGAYLAGAYLAGAYLARADLAGADLADAYLADADLAGANLARADLADANLARAYLADANLAGADLADADLAGANLARADLAGADLAGADLAGANLARADLADANLADANLADARNYDPSSVSEPAKPYVRKSRQERMLEYRARHPEVPVIEHLDAKILAAIGPNADKLDMGQWHSPCGTAHCRAGWTTTLAGAAGAELEAKTSTRDAAAAIYRASTGRVPHFFATNARALEDLRRCAAKDAGEGAT